MKTLLLTGLLIPFFTFMTGPDIPQKAEDISPLLIGETIPNVKLLDVSGKSIDLKAEVAKKPTLLVFYRGGWCPFCNTQLSDLRTIKPDMDKLGYQMIAISTDAPEGLRGTYDKTEVTYTLLSDADVAAAKAFGLAFKAPARADEMLLKSSAGKNTDGLLPVPAVFLLNTDGVIKYEHINPNYKERISAKLLKAVTLAMQEK